LTHQIRAGRDRGVGIEGRPIEGHVAVEIDELKDAASGPAPAQRQAQPFGPGLGRQTPFPLAFGNLLHGARSRLRLSERTAFRGHGFSHPEPLRPPCRHGAKKRG
jgi:hypothetical protein